jgi:hypothetical protein
MIGLLYIQIIAVVGMLVGTGLNVLTIPTKLFAPVFPSLCVELIGVIYIIARYLFNSSARQNVTDLMFGRGVGGEDRPRHRRNETPLPHASDGEKPDAETPISAG